MAPVKLEADVNSCQLPILWTTCATVLRVTRVKTVKTRHLNPTGLAGVNGAPAIGQNLLKLALNEPIRSVHDSVLCMPPDKFV